MFNIRKSKGNIITKAVTPSIKTGRQLATSLLDNIQLTSELEQVKSVLPTEPMVGAPLNDIASDERIKSKVHEIMYGTSAKQTLDEKAKASQIGYSATSRFIIRDNNRPLLPIGAPNAKIQKQIADENVLLMAHGKQPFTTYQSWVDAGDSLQDRPSVAWRKYEAPAPKAVATAPAFIVEHGYYILYDGGTCYYLSGNMSRPSILRRLASEEIRGQTQDNSSILMSVSNGVKYRNVSQSEYNSLVTDTPCKADLFKVFVQWDNIDKVLLDTSKAVPVWSKE